MIGNSERLVKWITSNIDVNGPIYADICKEIIPIHLGSIKSEDIVYLIDKSHNNTSILSIYVLDVCYRTDYPHSMETIIMITGSSIYLPGMLHGNVIQPNSHYFNGQTGFHPRKNGHWYSDTIFSYEYIMSRVRNERIDSILTDLLP
jgi:hypothetical protein